MSGLASFVTGAVGGYFQGKDWRESVEDRKRMRKMEDDRFQWEKSNQAYTEEERDWNREDRAHTVKERNREITRRDQEEAFFKSLAEDTTPPAPGVDPAPEADAPRRTVKPIDTQATTAAPSPISAPALPKDPTTSSPAAASAGPAANAPAPVPARTIRLPQEPQGTFFSDRAAQIGAPKEVQNLAAAADAAQAALANGQIRPEARAEAEATVKAATEAIANAAQPKPAPQLPATAGGYTQQPGTPPGPPPASPAGQVDALGRSPAEIAAALQSSAPSMAGRYAGRQIKVDPLVAAQTAPAQPPAPVTNDAPITLPGSASVRTAPPSPAPATAPATAQAPAQVPAQPTAPASPNLQRAEAVRRESGALLTDFGQSADNLAGKAVGMVNEAGNLIVRGAGYGTSLVSPEAGAKILDYADQTTEANQRLYDEGFASGKPRRIRAATTTPSPTAPTPADKLPAVTPTTDAGTPQPSLDAVTETAPRTVTPTGKPKAPTKEDAVKAQGSFLERYAKEKVPEIVKFYVARGDHAKADAYQKWADDTLVKEAMRRWASAVHAATIGDDQGFVDGIAAAYNAKGYYDDGYSIVPEASGIHRDEATGAILGAQVTFKDDATGQVFTQDFEGSEDLYRLGVDMLAPEQVFEIGWSRVQARDDIRNEVAKEIAKRGLSGGVKADDVLSAMEKMAKANLQFQGLPVEQQVQLALDFLARFGGATPGAATTPAAEVPVAPRP